tara:strand:+ start:2935 stop:4530 length:1596 start_codon:yes stop_codon:yes gene_type:complete
MAKKLKNIPAKAHPAHYMMHKYWGRKPHNVVSDYIKNYTKEGDTVLDPFMGSGVTIIESVKISRSAVGIDLNPLSIFITKNTLKKIDINKFDKEFYSILNKNIDKFSDLYITKCPSSNLPSRMLNSVYEENNLLKIKGFSENSGIFRKDADKDDLKIIKKSERLFKKALKDNEIIFPCDEILKYVKRSNKTHIDQLFTKRALLILSNIRRDILLTKDKDIRNVLMMCFSSMLPNVSKMIPGDLETVNGKSGWQISKLWAPKIHTEKNIFESFISRYKRIRKGKLETNFLIKSNKYKLYKKSSEFLKNIESNSIDYIFTDPPYGESIAYLGLSMFFNSWLDNSVNYNKEIIYDPYRNKKYQDYSVRLDNVFKELYRVLKKGKHLSFTFHNRDLKIWKSIIDAVNNAGFEMENIVYQEQAVASGTQGINFKNTFKGDFVYNFIKPESKMNNHNKIVKNPIKVIETKIDSIFAKNKSITVDKLYEILIPYIVKRNIYANENGDPVSIENILSKKYEYGTDDKDKKIYKWKIKTA